MDPESANSAPRPGGFGVGRREGRVTLLAGALGLALVVLAAVPGPRGVSLALFWLGGMTALGAGSFLAAGDRVATAVVVASALLRSALAVALYEVSARALPLFGPLQIGGGFWVFSPDSAYFHEYARGAAVALRAGLGLPFVSGSPDYPLLVTLAYRCFGPHPYYVIFSQIWTAGASVLLAFLLGRALWGAGGGRLVAVLVAFWPSLVLWSTQLLKDAPMIFLIIAFLFGFHRFQGARGRAALAWGAEQALALFLIFRLRFYVGVALVLAIGLAAAVKVLVGLARGARSEAARPASLVVGLAAAVLLSGLVNPEWLGKPRDREESHLRLARYMLSIGDVDGAYWQLRGAASVHYESNEAINAAARRALEQLRRQMGGAGDGSAASAAPGHSVDETRPATSTLFPAADGARPARPETSSTFWDALGSIFSICKQRSALLEYGGASNIDADVELRDTLSVVRYLPTALFNAALTPTPFTRFSGAGSTGALRALSTAEAGLIAALLVVVAWGLPRAVRREPELAACILAYSLVLASALGLTVPTVGLLVRFRLAFVLPLCLLAGHPATWWESTRFRSGA
jgi:hypothetical protein